MNADEVLGQLGGDTYTNLFSYCGNNPINRTDATGHYPIESGDISYKRPAATTMKQWTETKKKTTENRKNTVEKKYGVNVVIQSSDWVSIENSYRVTSAEDRLAVTEYLVYNDILEGCTKEYYAAEWRAHNDIYNMVSSLYRHTTTAIDPQTGKLYIKQIELQPHDLIEKKILSRARTVDLNENGEHDENLRMIFDFYNARGWY